MDFLIVTKLFIVFSVIVVSACNNDGNDKLQGYIEGEFTYISAKNSGEVAQVFVKKGQSVLSGEKLISLDDDKQRIQVDISKSELVRELAILENLKVGERQEERDIARAKIFETESALKLSQSKLKKFNELSASGYISSFEIEKISAEVNQQKQVLQRMKAEYNKQDRPAREFEIQAQQARVDYIKNTIRSSMTDLQHRFLYAPFSSHVYDVMYKKGEVAAAGAALISLLSDNALKVRFFIPHDLIRRVYIGQDILVSTPGEPQTIPAIISFISSKAEYTPPVIYNSKQSKMVFMVEANFKSKQEEFKPGLPVEVELK